MDAVVRARSSDLSKRWIVLGDRTTGDGTMITGAPDTDINGAKVCRKGDIATCPRHKGTFSIIAGCDISITIDGQPVALDGAALACGCRVMAGSQNLVFVDAGGADTTSKAYLGRALGSSRGRAEDPESTFDDCFKIELEDGSPASGYCYEILRKDGSLMEGVTDSEGMIPFQESELEESVEIRLLGRKTEDENVR
ncbi:hypothetical protein D3C81_456400 [compost metagenome]